MLLVLPAAYLVLALGSGLPAVPDRGPGCPLHGPGLALVQLGGRTAGSEPEGGFCVPPPGAALVQAFVSWPKPPKAPAVTGGCCPLGAPPSPGGCSPRGAPAVTGLVSAWAAGPENCPCFAVRFGLAYRCSHLPAASARKLWFWAT